MAKTPTKATGKVATKAPKISAKPSAAKPSPKAVSAAKAKKATPGKLTVKTKAPLKAVAAVKSEKTPAKAVEKAISAKTVKPVLKVVEAEKVATPVVLSAEAVQKVKKPAKAPKVDKSLLNLSEKPLGELQKKWSEYKEKYGKEKAPVYNMANTYEAAAPLQHKVLGWGFVVSVQNDRLEVLFESGSKVLISNYRPR